MSIYEIGRICVKIAGRDAGRKCVVVENVDDIFVMIDGDVRRKKVNIRHLEPLAEVIKIADKASHAEVKAAFEKLGLAVWDKKSKKQTERPKQIRKAKKKVVEEKSKKEKKAETKSEQKEVKKETVAEVSVEEKQEVEELSAGETVEAETKEE